MHERSPAVPRMLLDRYIFREWLKVFLLSLGATAGILLLEDMYNHLDDLISYGATGAQIGRYYLLLVPSLLPAVLPLSLLISVLFILGVLHRNNELTAMRAAGLDLFKITRSLWFAGALVALLLLYLNGDLVPRSILARREWEDSMRFAAEARRASAKDVGIVNQLGFDNRKDRRLWFMNRFSERTFQGFGVCVYQMDANGREVTRIVAREGYYDDAPDARHWVMIEGRELAFDNAGSPTRSMPFKKKAYPNLTEEPRLMKTLLKRPVDLSLFELREVLSKIEPQHNERLRAYEVRYHGIIASPFACIVVVGIAIPFAVAGVRSNPMVGVSKSAGLFFAYYVIANVFNLLGAQGHIPTIAAAWAPNVCMLSLAIWLFSRVR